MEMQPGAAAGSALQLSGAGAPYRLETGCDHGSPRFDSCRLCFVVARCLLFVSSRARHQICIVYGHYTTSWGAVMSKTYISGCFLLVCGVYCFGIAAAELYQRWLFRLGRCRRTCAQAVVGEYLSNQGNFSGTPRMVTVSVCVCVCGCARLSLSIFHCAWQRERVCVCVVIVQVNARMYACMRECWNVSVRWILKWQTLAAFSGTFQSPSGSCTVRQQRIDFATLGRWDLRATRMRYCRLSNTWI